MRYGMGKFGDTHYEVLEVPEDADLRQIRKARNRLIHEYHPDRVPEHLTRRKKDAHERTVVINEAYRILSNATERRSYDETLQRSRETQEPGKGAGNERRAEYSPAYQADNASGNSVEDHGKFLKVALKFVAWTAGSLLLKAVLDQLLATFTQYSLAWWLTGAVWLLCWPGVIVGTWVLGLIVLLILVAIRICEGVIWLIKYFVANPY